MGIKGLHQFLKKTCPNVYVTVPLSKYAFKKIAIDTSIFMCKFKTSYGSNYLDAFLQLISTLRYNEIHFVFVYDTKAPPEKDKERKHRVESREKSKLRVEMIRKGWELLLTLIPEKESITLTMIDNMKDSNPEYTAFYQFIDKIYEETKLHREKIEKEILKLENTLLSIRSEDFLLTKDFFKACNIPFIDAESEAEATCAALAKQGYVSAVLTEDTDVLAYGSPLMLHRLDYSKHTCLEIDLEEVLNTLKFTYEQWLDFCILCGTDYNNNLFRIGPEKAYKMISNIKSIDNIIDNYPKIDISCLNHNRVRELFLKPYNFNNYELSYCGFPDKDLFEKLYFINNCNFNLKNFYSCFYESIFHNFNILNDKSNDTIEKENKKILLLSNLPSHKHY